MKLRLFGCAAAYVLAGTLYVSAQDATSKMDGPSEAGPPSEKKNSPGANKLDRSPNQGQSQGADGASDGGKADRADSQGAQGKRAGDDSPSLKKGKADTAADKSGAADKSDRSKGTSNSATDASKASREKSAEREGNRKSEPSAASEQDSGTADNRRAKSEPADRAGKSRTNVQLSADKRDRLQSTFQSEVKLKRETKADVNISVGSRAHRSWAFAPVPTSVIEIVPEYRGYVVAYVEDEYVICDPDTYEIVAVLPASGSDGLATTGRSTGESGAHATCSTSLTLTERERQAILTEVEMTNEVDVSGVTVGWSVPSNVELKPLPRSIVDRSSELQACRYFVVDEQVALVDPDDDKVVLLIAHK
jgi:hypothetical protein